jgi:putative acetyltransferase
MELFLTTRIYSMNNQFQIRRATAGDPDEIISLFRETVLAINKQDYNEEQVRLWSTAADKKDNWLKKIGEQYFVCAVFENKIIGFASLASDGYLDFMYVHKDCQGRGVASLLYQHLEMYAAELKLAKIYSEVSITAKPFFEKKDFVVIGKQQKLLGGVAFVNYRMEKCF